MAPHISHGIQRIVQRDQREGPVRGDARARVVAGESRSTRSNMRFWGVGCEEEQGSWNRRLAGLRGGASEGMA